MALEIKRYVHVPLYAEGVLVTPENMVEVAKWCEGTVSLENGKPFIKVATIRPIRERQTQAFAGDYVLKTVVGIKVYTAAAFKRSFMEPPVPIDEAVEEEEAGIVIREMSTTI